MLFRSTIREKEILKLIAEGRSSKEIGGFLGISNRTVERHRSNMKAKLSVRKTAELVHYENLFLCKKGEAGKFIDEGGGVHPNLGGKSPVNVSGGLLSKGHPLGATGVANICEVVWHLTGDERAKERQVPNAKAGQAHVIGLGSACTINILTV